MELARSGKKQNDDGRPRRLPRKTDQTDQRIDLVIVRVLILPRN